MILAATPSPTATGLPRGLEPTDVTPGVAGFLATAFVVVLSIFLILNLVSRMRRIRHRAAVEEARELAARRAAEHPADAGTAIGPEVVPGEVREAPPRRSGADRDGPDTPGPAAT